MKTKKTIPPCLSIIFILLCFVSCADTYTSTPPFILSKPTCSIGTIEPAHTYAGIHFTLHNTSGKTIAALEITCMVFENMTGDNPFIGSNRITAQFTGDITPHAQKKFIVSLDSYLYVQPQKPYIIDYFYISHITYTDGTTWTDPLGIYATRSY